MAFTWYRQTRIYDFENDPIDNTIETLSPDYYAYATDYKFYAEDTYSVPAQGSAHEGTVVFRVDTTSRKPNGDLEDLTSFSEVKFTWTETSGSITHEKREERTGLTLYNSSTDEHEEIYSSDWDIIHDRDIGGSSGHSRTTQLTIRYTVISKAPGESVGSLFGSRTSSLRYFEDDVEDTTNFPVHIGNYDVRELRTLNLSSECPTDPKESNVVLTGDFHSLPAPGQSPLFPAGWKPDSSVSYSLLITTPKGLITLPVTTAALLTGAPESNGRVASFVYSWDGRDPNGDFCREETQLDIEAIASVPGPGNTREEQVSSALTYSRCARGEGQVECTFCMLESGLMAVLRLIYLSFDRCRTPQSLGYGWSSKGSARVTELTSGDLVYRNEAGRILRWSPDGNGGYEPAHPDNYVKAELSSGNYLLTFKDQSLMRFDTSSGKLLEEEDRNGNKVTYSYNGSGHLSQASDDRGRVLYYDYGTRLDGQPVSVRSMNATTGRQVQFQYYSSSDSVVARRDRLYQTIDPEGEITRFDYNEDGLLSKVTRVQPTIGDHVTEYEYSRSGRLLSQTVNGEVRTSYSHRSYYSPGSETSHHETVVETIDLTLPENQQYPPLRTTLYRHDSFGNLIRIEEGASSVAAS